MLFKKQFAHPVLYLYQNSKTVVIGKHQNPWKECNLDYMKSNEITLCRRTSGGGAVYQDMGNLCFSFINTHCPHTDFKKLNSNILISSLASLGLKASFNGRNDILYNNRKISGSAFRLDYNAKPKHLHHGTLLFNVDIAMMTSALNPHYLKLVSNSVNSIKSRVINIKSFLPSVTMHTLKDSIINEFLRTNGLSQALKADLMCSLPDESKSASDKILDERYRYYQSWKWKYGETPEFTNVLVQKFLFGLIDLSFKVAKGVIEDIKVYSDSNDTQFIDNLRDDLATVINKVRGEVKYDRQGLNIVFNQLSESIRHNQVYLNHVNEMHSVLAQML